MYCIQGRFGNFRDLLGQAAHLVEVRGEEGEAARHGRQVVRDRVRQAVPRAELSTRPFNSIRT